MIMRKDLFEVCEQFGHTHPRKG